MKRLSIVEVLRRFGLAFACVIGPVLLEYPMDLAVGQLVPQADIAGAAKAPLQYSLRAVPAPPPRETNTEADAKGAAKAAPDPRVVPYANHLAGRYRFGVVSGVTATVAAIALLFAAATIFRRAGWRVLAVAAGLSAALAAYVGHNVAYRPYARRLLIDGILAEADKRADLGALKASATATADAVNAIMYWDTVIGVFAMGLVMGAVCVLSIRGPAAALELDALKRRLREIRVALALVSALLVLYVLASMALLHWPLSLLEDAQRLALRPVADAVLFHWSATATVVLLLIFAPAIVAWALDVEAYRAAQDHGTRQAGKARPDDGLRFAPLSAVTSFVAVLGPVLAPPVVDVLKAIVEIAPGR